MNIENTVHLPSYLEPPGPANHFYGELVYDPDKDYWIIKGEPCVCQMAKRLFPGSEGKGRSQAKFKVNQRTLGDLNWLMHRYPLIIANKDKWDRDFERARRHVLAREKININPAIINPSKTFFNGELLPYQMEGLGHMLVNRRTLIGDEMGLGKTVQGLAFLSETQSFPALIVVPPHLVRNWTGAIDKFMKLPAEESTNISMFDDSKPRVHVIKGLKPYELPNAHIHIIHYLLLRGWKDVLPNYGYQTVIFDEIQELRHTGTEKYSAASLIAESANNAFGLSGTPIHNKGAEIHNVMNIIDFHCLGDYDSFTREWCQGYGSEIVNDPELLGEHLRREGLMIRRTKNQVLKDLPRKRRVVQEIDSDEKVFSNLIADTLEKVKCLSLVKDVLERGRLRERISQETRLATGVAKASFVCDFVKLLLEAGEKVLLFAHHHAVMDVYEEELESFNPVFITGRQSDKEKAAAEAAFMNGETNICCISLRSCSGLNLQRASCVVFGELDWSPAVHSQAEDRAHRLGQKDSVLCYYLVSASGSDQDVQEALGLKISQFVGIMGDEVETSEDRMIAQTEATKHINGIIDRLMIRIA